MKVFQIFKGKCYWDATNRYPTIQDTAGKFSPKILFVETPNYVREGWGFDDTKEGDERFIKPIEYNELTYDTDLDVWYDPNTGIPKSTDERIKDLDQRMFSGEGQVTDLQMALCETYESSENQLTDLQLAVTELYEMVLSTTKA